MYVAISRAKVMDFFDMPIRHGGMHLSDRHQ
jgi:hypothetical protein